MNPLVAAIRAWARDVAQGWDRFWFTPALPYTLALIRILGGGMLLYSHAVWTLDLDAFLGSRSWLDASAARLLNQTPDGANYAFSHLFDVQSPALLWALHLAALAVFALLTVGLFTRVVAPLACLLTLSYCHRLTGALFGLDQINAFIATYLMVGACGGAYSLDRWRSARRGAVEPVRPSVSVNIAIRLLQIHMCVIYLFGGIGKARGDLWWDGSALWYAFASLEYQSLDMTWTVAYPWALALLTHVTLFWETFYCFLVWPRLTRPICLALAVFVHAGIAICLGMKTFGLAMIVGNLAFVDPETVRDAVAWLSRRWGPAVAERATDEKKLGSRGREARALSPRRPLPL